MGGLDEREFEIVVAVAVEFGFIFRLVVAIFDNGGKAGIADKVFG